MVRQGEADANRHAPSEQAGKALMGKNRFMCVIVAHINLSNGSGDDSFVKDKAQGHG